MISAVCTQIVEDFGKGSLYPVHSISGSNNIRPWTVLVENHAKIFNIQQHTACDFLIADVVRGHLEGFEKIAIQNQTLTNSYSRKREVALGSTMALEIFKLFPNLKAQAYATGNILMNIKTGGLTLKKIDENEFKKSLSKLALDREHSFFHFWKDKNVKLYTKMLVIESVLEIDEETVIEFTCKNYGNADVSSKTLQVADQNASVSAEAFNCKAETLNLEAGTVLACGWQQMIIDKSKWLIGLQYEDSVHSNSKFHYYNSSTEEENKSEEETNESSSDETNGDENRFDENENRSNEDKDDSDEDDRDQDCRLYDLYYATEEQIRKFKDAVGIVVRSTSDCNALLKLLEDDGGEAKKFRSQLQKSEEVWTLLGLMGYEIQKKHIKQTTRGPFRLLVPAVLESSTLVDREDLERISNCNDYQKTELLRIIKAADDFKEYISVDTKFLQELQNEPVENIVGLIDVKIDFQTGQLLLPNCTDILKRPIKYLLHSL